jgi:hypothetical protein
MKTMRQNRREFLRSMAGFGGLILCGAAKLAMPDYAGPLRAALAFLESRQSRDGAWRSDHYGAFREGDALTPLALWAMQDAPALAAPGGAFIRGLRWLERLTDAQAQNEETGEETRYPLFTASYAAQVFAKAGDKRRAGVWAARIARLRIRYALGWPVHDPACGAWGDSPFPPQLPQGVHPPPDMLAPNLSATLLGVRGMAAGDRGAKLAEARPFIESCQNFATQPAPEFDDGGFLFAPDDSVRNKAGAAGRDAGGRVRFNSYGSATCDGFLALHSCGLPADHPRMAAAAAWIRQHGAGLGQSGRWMAARAEGRESLAFYYGQALADALAVLSREPTHAWAAAQQRLLASDLIERQRENGAWEGRATRSCEDDPLVATAFGAHALTVIGRNYKKDW